MEREASSPVNGDFVSENKKKPNACFSPVVMVLQSCASPNFTTPLRCKDFYSSSSAPVCRICHEEDSPDSLISPCNCMGSLGRMHKKCLEKWLSMSSTSRCEICKFRFEVTYHNRHFGEWLLSGSVLGPKGFLWDMIGVFFLLPLSIMALYLCAFGARNYMYKHEWQATALALLFLFILIAFILWSGLTFRFHYQRFRSWQRSNLMIRVNLENSQRNNIEASNSHANHGRLANTPDTMESGRYTPMPQAELSYNFNISTLPLGFGAIIMTETRL